MPVQVMADEYTRLHQEVADTSPASKAEDELAWRTQLRAEFEKSEVFPGLTQKARSFNIDLSTIEKALHSQDPKETLICMLLDKVPGLIAEQQEELREMTVVELAKKACSLGVGLPQIEKAMNRSHGQNCKKDKLIRLIVAVSHGVDKQFTCCPTLCEIRPADNIRQRDLDRVQMLQRYADIYHSLTETMPANEKSVSPSMCWTLAGMCVAYALKPNIVSSSKAEMYLGPYVPGSADG
jgi:hypothetical protein